MDSTYQTLVSEQNSSQDSTLESLTNSSKKYNLSFTMNLDEDIDSEFSSDSEKVDLKIDVEEVDNYETPKKRCRYDDNDKITGINEMEEEIERQLDAKAAKTNLTATNVKNILKHVIMNEDVISMVHNKVHNSDEKILYEPKLTRSKAKELASSMPDLPWNITPKKKTVSPHMQVLVNNDLLHEDSSDDEYDPNKDHPEPSEDEGDTVEGSDIDSEPLTPISVVNTTEPIDTNIIQENHYNFNDNEFKIPVAPYVLTEEESIGQRTRSKLCLSETPIEQLEREFIPPDILPDMYHNGHLANDPNWGELFNSNGLFLDDDDINDPSYNILEDNETETVDKEELRSDKTVKVSKKEKDLLYEELNDFNNMSTNNSLPKLNNDQSRKKKSLDGINLMESHLNNSSNEIMYDSFQVFEEPTVRCHVSQEQCNIISYQLEQHVQLMTQHFMMSYMHPKSEIHVQSTECKNNLNNLIQLQHPNQPLFYISNLPDAMKLINVWENKLDDKTFCESYVKQLEFDMEHGINQSKRRHKYVAKFNSELLELLMESKALMYPELLPHIPFRVETLFQTNLTYCKSEENLLALGVEKYLPYVKSSGRRFRSTKYTVYDAMCHVCKELMPNRKPDRLVNWMSSLRRPNVPYNAVQFYYEHGYAPVVTYNIPLKRENKSPKNCETSLLPKTWQDWIKNKEKKKTPSSTPTNNNVRTLYKILPIKTAIPVEINQMINNPNNSLKTKKVIKSKNTTKQLAKTVNVKNLRHKHKIYQKQLTKHKT
ncbi:hypothetical protein HCN44_002650 [Aphidius gifuensis]|uniref:Uncharacterized protein n=1 Tax=Aphidius gifuensis TaxID=684658 RepID=A0A834XR81_APHGI|nr:hypothetical protein HCN44_002650 [Aphidius gifuensis]